MVLRHVKNCMTLRDTILYSRGTLTVDEVYGMIYSKERIKQLVIGLEAQAQGHVVS